MSLVVKTLWHHVSVKRVLVVSVFITIAAFMLLFFLASLGDSDLPPYVPDFPGERLGWKIVTVVAWPLTVYVGFVGQDPPFALWLPLTFVAGIFWALAIETFVVVRHAQRA